MMMMMVMVLVMLVIMMNQPATSFQSNPAIIKSHYRTTNLLFSNKSNSNNIDLDDAQENVVKVGSKEYYSGFLSRDLQGESGERVSGDALLGPTMKFIAGSTVILTFFFVGFLVANGLL